MRLAIVTFAAIGALLLFPRSSSAQGLTTPSGSRFIVVQSNFDVNGPAFKKTYAQFFDFLPDYRVFLVPANGDVTKAQHYANWSLNNGRLTVTHIAGALEFSGEFNEWMRYTESTDNIYRIRVYQYAGPIPN
jgi:hypothetical protein